MSTFRTVDEIFSTAYPNLCKYSDAKNVPKYTNQVKWAERTYIEQFEEEEDVDDVGDKTEDVSVIFEHLRSVETITKNMSEKTHSLETALRDHMEEVEAVRLLFVNLQTTVAGIMRRLDEKRESRHDNLLYSSSNKE